MKLLRSMFLLAAMSSTANAYGMQAPPAKTTKAAPAPATAAPTAAQIADAKAKGMVWVNTTSKVYHKDGEFYGKTKRGQFMTEGDAQKAGFRAARASATSKKKTSK